MPLRLNVGVSRKIGLPKYSSIGASCSLEVELETGLLRDLDGFHDQVRDAFVAARQAVNDELSRLQAQARSGEPREAPTADGHRDGPPATDGRPAAGAEARGTRPGRAATPNQVKAIVSIARRQRADLDGMLCDRGVTRPEELSLADASRIIDQLKAAAGA